MTTATTLPGRADVPEERTWDIASLFADEAAWSAAASELRAALPELEAFRGTLGSSAGRLLEWLETVQRVGSLAHRLLTYASMSFDVDTGDQARAALADRAAGLWASYHAATAFAEPELVGMGAEALERLIAAEPGLALYRHYIGDLLRRGAHLRTGEVEQLLARASEPFGASYSAYQMLADGDLRFRDAYDFSGRAWPVERGKYYDYLQSGDRALRKSAWEAHADGFLAFKNTFGAIYAGSVKADVFLARTRGHADALELALHEPNLPRAVYEQVIDACNRHLPTWHRYWEIRRRALGLARLEPCDIFAPLVEGPAIDYPDGVALICEGMAPLGEEYVAISRAGLGPERWVDIYPNRGKTSGAYSSGSHGTKPYILVNYNDSLLSVSTLAHELGHSMHTLLSWRAQPPIYSQYSNFVAEVASNFNQALLRGHLLGRPQTREFEIALLEEAMTNFHRYLFLMPILSQFEHAVHGWAQAGEPITADRMNELLADLFERGYGPAVDVDRPRNGITWAQFPHLYTAYYTFQYASGIAGANALAAEVLAGAPGAAARYLEFLATGSARYPIDALRLAGIDMTTPDPMDRAFSVFAGYVDRLGELLG